MRIAKRVLFGLAGALLVWALFPLILSRLLCFWNGWEAASMGIIGGADGPTAIFVTSKLVVWPFLLRFIPAIACATAGFVLHRLSKNKEK